MNALLLVRLAAWSGCVLGIAALARAASGPVGAPHERADSPTDAPGAIQPPEPSRDHDSALRVVISGSLFQRSRTPGLGPRRPAPFPIIGPPESRPQLRLVGLVSGKDPTAVITGFPPGQSQVVRAGDVIGPLTVSRVGVDTVEIRGMDTTWVLTVRTP